MSASVETMDWRAASADASVDALRNAFRDFKKKTHEGQLRMAAASCGVIQRFGADLAKEIIQNCLRVKGQTAQMYIKWGERYGVVPEADIWLALGADGVHLLEMSRPDTRTKVIEDVRRVSRRNQEATGSATVTECFVSTQLTAYGDSSAAMANRCSAKRPKQKKEEEAGPVAEEPVTSEDALLSIAREVRDAVFRNPDVMAQELSTETIVFLRNLK
jgi:hypothetical protein